MRPTNRIILALALLALGIYIGMCDSQIAFLPIFLGIVVALGLLKPERP